MTNARCPDCGVDSTDKKGTPSVIHHRPGCRHLGVTACGFCERGVYRGKPCPYCDGTGRASQGALEEGDSGE